MRRFRGRSFRRGSKRSVAWIPGFSGMDPLGGTFARFLQLTALGVAANNTWAAAVQLTTDTDLSMHGGEDAVLQRIRGNFAFIDGQRNAGAGLVQNSFLLRCCVICVDVPIPGTISPFEYVDSAGLGADNILWMRDMVVPSTALGVTGTGLDAQEYGDGGRFAFVDVKAKRRIQSDRQVFLTMQTVLPAGTTAAQMRLLGHLRILLKRPR